MVQISSRYFLALASLSLPIFARAISAPPAQSPSAETELICPTDNQAECYPRLFQPTKDFQVIQEGQDIPPGLHVRMNIWSGEREARLNIPMEGEDSEAVIEVPLEQSVVVVDQPEEGSVQEEPAMRDRVPQKPPPYDPVGQVKEPQEEGAKTDTATFHRAISTIKSGTGELSPVLEELSELGHDIFYGSELAKDSVVLEKLACLMSEPNSQGLDHKAASVLGSAIQNNPTAIREIAKVWKHIMYPTCGGNKQDLMNKLRSTYETSFHNLSSYPATLKAQIHVLSGLLKEPSIRADFLSNKGMEFLSLIYSMDGAEWKGVRNKIAQLIMDNFLDENMGAELGVWPTQPLLEDKVCASQERMLEDGCWEYHVERLSDDWSKEFLQALKAQRAESADSVQDREL